MKQDCKASYNGMRHCKTCVEFLTGSIENLFFACSLCSRQYVKDKLQRNFTVTNGSLRTYSYLTKL